MSTKTPRFAYALTAAAGGLLAAMTLGAASASADVWTIDIVPGGGNPPPEVVSVSGMPPFDLTTIEQGQFGMTDHHDDVLTEAYVQGVLSDTQSFGFTNQLFVANGENPFFPAHSVLD